MRVDYYRYVTRRQCPRYTILRGGLGMNRRPAAAVLVDDEDPCASGYLPVGFGPASIGIYPAIAD